MNIIEFTVHHRPYVELRPYGADHTLARIAALRTGTDAAGSSGLVSLLDAYGGGALLDGSAPCAPSGSSRLDSRAVAERLAALNPGLPPPPEDAVYVVAGQQPGLLTGPLYTVLKAIQALALARRLADRWKRTVLPLFWVASEDHDVLEVNRVHLSERRFVHPYEGMLRRGEVPQVADISLEEARDPLLGFLRETLPRTEFTEDLLDAVGSVDFTSYETAFIGWMQGLFGESGLYLAPAPALRSLTGPVLADTVERWPEILSAFARGTARLAEAGIEPPLGRAGIFMIREGKRVPLSLSAPEPAESCPADEDEVPSPVAGGTGSDPAMSIPEAALAVRERPEDFSPNAALRPLVQDGALPVAAFVAGPSELLYLLQIRPLYAEAGVRPAPLVPRMTATFVERAVARAARKAGLTPDRIFEAPDAMAEGLAEADPDPTLAELRERTEALLAELDRLAADRGPAGRWLVRSRDAVAGKLEKTTRRLIEEGLAKQGLMRSRLEKITAAVLPGGIPQERWANVFQFVNLHGPAFVRRALERLDPEALDHQIVEIVPAPGSAGDGRDMKQQGEDP